MLSLQCDNIVDTPVASLHNVLGRLGKSDKFHGIPISQRFLSGFTDTLAEVYVNSEA